VAKKVQVLTVDGKLYLRASHLMRGFEETANSLRKKTKDPEMNPDKLEGMAAMLEIQANLIRDLIVSNS
jgi:hypothetical protein